LHQRSDGVDEFADQRADVEAPGAIGSRVRGSPTSETGVEQRAAEHARHGALGAFTAQQRDERSAPGVVTRMRAIR
jgi:hypothetical protein